jgi:hypothetical protein
VRDRDGDGVADEYRTLSSRWDLSGHPFDFLFGFATDGAGNVYCSSSTPHERGDLPGFWRRGAILRIAPGGETSVFARGTRLEFGWATDAAGRAFFTVNQGPWMPTNSINLLEEGAHHGYRARDAENVTPPVVRAPYPWCRSLSGLAFAETGGRFGAFEGQGIAADYNTRRLIRWTSYEAGGRLQGACYDFAGGLDLGPTGLCFGPEGALYVAAMVDGVWITGRPRGGIYRIAAGAGGEGGGRSGDDAPVEVLEARATRAGFAVRFTAPLDPRSLEERVVPRAIHRFTYAYRGGYYSDEVAHEDVAIAERALAADGRVLDLRLAGPHVAPRIYRLDLRGLRAAGGRPLATGAFYVTVEAAPE